MDGDIFHESGRRRLMLFLSAYLIPLPSSGSRDIGALPPCHGGGPGISQSLRSGHGFGSSLRAGLSRDLIVPLAAAARNWRALNWRALALPGPQRPASTRQRRRVSLQKMPTGHLDHPAAESRLRIQRTSSLPSGRHGYDCCGTLDSSVSKSLPNNASI